MTSWEKTDFEAGITRKQEDGFKRYKPIFLIILGTALLIGIIATTFNQVQPKQAGTLSFVSEEDVETSNAPLFLQKIDNTNFLNKFMIKYGLDGSDGADNYDAVDSAAEKGWAYVSIYPSSTCSGTEYAIGGVVTEECFTYYGDDDEYASLKFQCSNGEIILNKYDDDNCIVLTASKIITTEGCKELNSTWNCDFDDTFYGNIQCSTGQALPIHGDYDLFRGYVSDSTDTCDGLAFFEANPLDTCVPIYWQDKSHSIIFGVESDDDSTPYATLYTESVNCTGSTASLDLHTSCTAITFNEYETNSSDVSYDWEYYTTTDARTLHPSLAPTVALELEDSKPSVLPTFAPLEESQSPTPAPSEEVVDTDKTGNPTRSWLKTDNPTPENLHPSEAPVQVKVAEDVVHFDPDSIFNQQQQE